MASPSRVFSQNRNSNHHLERNVPQKDGRSSLNTPNIARRGARGRGKKGVSRPSRTTIGRKQDIDPLGDAGATRGLSSDTQLRKSMKSSGIDALWHIARLKEARERGTTNATTMLHLLGCAIKAAGKAGINKMAQGLLTKALEPSAGLRPGLNLFHSALQSVSPATARTAVPTIMSFIDTTGLRPNRSTYKLALVRLAEAGEWEYSLQLLRRIAESGDQALMPGPKLEKTGQDQGYKGQKTTTLTAIPEDEEQVSHEIRERNYDSFLPNVLREHVFLALDACQKAGEWKEGLILMRGAVKSGHPRSARMYAAVASAMSTSDKPGRALKIFNEAGHVGIKLSLCLYHAALHACARRGFWEKAIRLVGNAVNNGLEPNAVTYTTQISSFMNRGKWAHALRTLRRMEREGICAEDERAVAAANQAMSVCIKGRAWRRALDIFEDWMPRAGVNPDIQSVNVAIRAHGRGGSWQSALALSKRLMAFNLQPNVHTFTSLAVALSFAGQWKEAFLQMQRLSTGQYGLEHNPVSKAILITTAGKAFSWGYALEIFHKFLSEHQQFGNKEDLPLTNAKEFSKSIAAMMKTLVESEQEERALHLYADYIKRPGASTYLGADSHIAAMQGCEREGRWETCLRIQKILTGHLRGNPDGNRNKLQSEMVESYATSLMNAGRWMHALNYVTRRSQRATTNLPTDEIVKLFNKSTANRDGRRRQESKKPAMNARRYNISVICATKMEQWEEALTLLFEWGRQNRAQARRTERRAMEQKKVSKSNAGKEMVRLHIPDTVPRNFNSRYSGPVRFDGTRFDPIQERSLREAAKRTEDRRRNVMHRQQL